MNLFKSTLIATALVAAGFAGNASAATTTGDFQVQITITESCDFSTGGANNSIDFGDKARSETGDVLGSGNLVVNCTPGTPFTIALGAGGSGDIANREMSFNGNSVGYNLYTDGGRTTIWGNTTGTTVSNTGTGVDQSIPVFGRVPGGANVNVPAGTYTDTVVATITY